MNAQVQLNQEEMDAFKEVINIGMGKAGAALSEILEGFVSLKVPEVQLLELDNLIHVLEKSVADFSSINMSKQSFVDQIRGEILFIFAPIAYERLGKILGFENLQDLTANRKSELILEISNSLSSACLFGLSNQLGLSVALKPPNMVCLEEAPDKIKAKVFGGKKPSWDHTLLIKIEFSMSDIQFNCEILVFVAEDSILPLKNALNTLLED